jgi:hypothetical protein
MVAAAAAGAVALQLTLPLTAEGGLWPAASAAGRAAVLAGALVALARAGVAMTRGSPRGGVWGAGICVWHVVVATATILAALLWRHPGRLVLNEVGFVLTAAPLGWVVARRAGRAAAVEAALALAALALASTFADVRRPPAIVEWAADSRFRWGTGWPADGWVLRHEIALDQPAPAAAMRLTAPLTREYAGPAWVLARVNDHDLRSRCTSRRRPRRCALRRR